MASYTDNAQALSQFNPYVQQLPVEAMVEVGMKKQQMYNEGIQKIQTNIDNIAGMDVIRGVDRKYLQSKLNEVGNNLRTVAAGDFSDFQLVNSASGMVNQIARDKYVQNAVNSSAKYRKEAAQMESDIREGKSSPENQWDFSVKSNEWLQSDDINKSFNEKYTKYTDVNKKMLDVFKTLHPNLRAEDLAYVTTNGKVDYTKAAAVMQRVSHEAVSADQIENAIRANLDANDLNQMGITGRYTFKDMPPENIERYYTQQATKQAGDIDKQLAGLQQIVNTSASDPLTLNKAKEAMENLEAKKAGLPQQLLDTLEIARKNPDFAKSQIYKEGAISQFAAGMSWENAKLELLKSPVKDEEHWQIENALNKAKFNLDISKFKTDTYYKGENLKVAQGHLSVAQANSAIAAKKAMAEIQGPDSGADVYLGESTKIVKDPNIAMITDINDLQTSRNLMIGDLAKQMRVTPDVAKKALDSYKNGDQTKIPSTLRNRADNILNTEKKALNYTEILKNTEKEALNDPVVVASRREFNDRIKKQNGLAITVNGKKINYTAEEVHSFLNTKPENRTAKQHQLQKVYNDAGRSDYSTIKKVFNNINKLSLQTDNSDDVYKERYNEILKTKTGKYVPAMYNIDVLEKDGSRGRVEGIAKSLMMVYEGGIGGQAGGRAEFTEDDNDKASTWLNNKDRDHLQYKKITQGDKTFLAVVNGAEEVLIPIDKANEHLLPRNAREPSPEERDIKFLQVAGNGNTNLTGNPVRGHFGKNDFISVKRLKVTGDLNANMDTGVQYLNLNIQLPNGRWQNLQIDDYPMYTQDAINTVKTLTDTQIKDIYLKNPNVPESVKAQIRTLN